MAVAQRGLFGGEQPVGTVGPAPADAELQDLGRRLPAELYLGTSSWGFPGWSGLVYDRAASEAVLARDGLPAYARHPLFRTVGLDRTFYQPVDASVYAGLAAQVPPGFRFLVKAHDHLCLARFPRHRRYGDRAGRDNPRFLDPAYAVDQVVGPWLEGLSGRAGPLLLQLPPQDLDALGGPQGFAERVHAFFLRLPRLDPRAGDGFYSLEVRNPQLLVPELADALADVRVVPCLTAHGTMPNLRTQWRLLQAGRHPAAVVRWMLVRGLDFDQAYARYQPFDRLVDPDPELREVVARLCAAMAARDTPTWVIANNKAEGSAPHTLRQVAERLLALREAGFSEGA